MMQPNIDIIHMRDPDSACDFEVYVDGVRADMNHVNFYDFDPGAGYEMSDWEENRDWALKNAPEHLKDRLVKIYDDMKPTYRRWSLG